MIDETKGINNDVSGWYPIYNIYNSQLEIGKINLVYEILSSEVNLFFNKNNLSHTLPSATCFGKNYSSQRS